MLHRSRWFIIVAFMLTLCVGTSAYAESSSQKRILPLVVEETKVEASVEGAPVQLTRNFWWGGSESPLWTETDEILSKLSKRFIFPGSVAQISSIFKDGNLTQSNAVSLGKTFGADQILLGRFRRTKYGERPLMETLQSLELVADIIDLTSTPPKQVQHFEVRRTFLSNDPSDEKTYKNQMLMTVIETIKTSKKVPESPDLYNVVMSEKVTVSLRQIATFSELQEVISELKRRSDIKDVEIGWVSQDVITLELVPESSALNNDEIINFLRSNTFNNFRIDVTAGPSEGVILGSRVRLN